MSPIDRQLIVDGALTGVMLIGALTALIYITSLLSSPLSPLEHCAQEVAHLPPSSRSMLIGSPVVNYLDG